MSDIRFTDLQPRFLKWIDAQIYRTVDRIEDARGVSFLCPKCYAANGGPVRTHSVICWSRSRGVPDEASPKPGRWSLDGTGFHDLTLNGDPPGGARSVQLMGGCAWHGFITKGMASLA